MKVCLVAVLVFAVLALALYGLAGRWVSVRVRREERRADRHLQRALRRTTLYLQAAALLLLAVVLLLRPALSRVQAVALVYALPLLWIWIWVLGSSWIELRARALDIGLRRFHRFNLFAWFLVNGQRIPFLSAAAIAPADLAAGKGLVSGVLLHLGLALALGLALRWATLHANVEHGSLPDPELLGEIREVADRAGVGLRDVRLVRTERGQSVNALAATSSRVIYVAQGLYEGLDREEVKAVLLHELGHLAQRATNLFRNAAVLGIPFAVWAARAILRTEDLHPLLLVWLGVAVLAAVPAARRVYLSSEQRADRFAERWGTPGALGSALRKMYARNLRPRLETGGRRHPDLEARIRELSRPA